MVVAERAIEIVYLLPDREDSLALTVAPGTTIAELLRMPAVQARFDAAALTPTSVGVYGKRVAPDYILAAGDRVELYRPLRTDPKEARRQRARRG